MPRQKITIRPPASRPAPPKPAPPPRGIVGNVAGFGRGFASGVQNIVVGTAQGAVSLAKGGYALATNPQARAQAMQTGRAIANGVKGYAGQAYKDPKKALRDAQAGVNSMYNQFNSARKAAAARGQSAEFWGNASAEIGSMLVPGGALAKGARGTKLLSVASKAKNIIAAPIVKATKSAVSVLPCGKTVPFFHSLGKLPKGHPRRTVAANNIKAARRALRQNRPDLLAAERNVVVKAFDPETLRVERLKRPEAERRRYGGPTTRKGTGADPIGAWTSKDKFRSPKEAQRKLALLDNAADKELIVGRPKGTLVLKGKVAPQKHENGKILKGGANQTYTIDQYTGGHLGKNGLMTAGKLNRTKLRVVHPRSK